MLRISTLLTFLFFCSSLSAQMWNGTDSIYGNEWIDYDQSYFKVMVTEDGMHRLSKSALEAAGLPMNSINGGQLQVFCMGEEIPVYVSSDQTFGGNDYLEFYGQKNRGDFDRYLYKDADNEMLNPEYSLVTDTAAYFITWVPNGTTVNRFEEVDIDLTNLPAPESFYMARSLANFTNRSVQESFGQGDVYYSTFTGGEGYGTIFKASHSFNLNTSDVVTTAGSSLILRMATSKSAHDIDITFGGEQLANVTPNGYTLFADTFDISSTLIENNNEVTVNSNSNDQDKTSVANAWLIYPRAFNFNGENQFIFQVEASSNDKYIEVNNFNAEGQAPVVYDITTGQRIETALEAGVVKFRLESTTLSGERTLVLSSQVTGYKNATATEVNFIDYTSEDADFIIISHPKLYNDGNGNNFVAEYANYRSSTQGGAYESLVVDVQQLYDQFGYGLNRHFLSIRNFGHYIKSNWTNPQYVFIIGKGREYINVRNNLQLGGATTFTVPTFGSPGADNLLMARLDSDVPVIPIGRIAVSDPEDIKTYLDKIQLMESGGGAQTIEDQLWKKELMHLGGGGTANEQITIRNHLQSMEAIIEESKFGGNVTGFYKTSTDPIQIGESDDIFNRINAGVSMITFFGHSAVGTFDFNIDNPNRYENLGKYPVMLSLGCYSGNIHTSSQGLSERFIFLKDKGAIIFGAATGQGYISALSTMAKNYYNQVGEDLYGESIGILLQRTIQNFESNNSFTIKTLLQQFTLHGDPAYRIAAAKGPDFVVDARDVRFEPSNLTTSLDSFSINFSLTNLGFAIEDSVQLLLEQELPNGELVILKNFKVPSPKYKNSFVCNVASLKRKASGQNKLHIKIDQGNEVPELPNPAAEMNNFLMSSNGSAGLPFYIFDDSARPVYPPEFAIVNSNDLTLKASTSNALANERKYIIQIDTTELFNSSFLESAEISQLGGVIEWSPGINMVDSTVFYWRISPDSTGVESPFVWESSSFVYLPSSTNGWNQSHLYQYQRNEFDGLELNNYGGLEIDTNGFFITINNRLYDPAVPPSYIYNFGNAAASVRPWNFINAGVAVVVGDSITGSGWINPSGGNYGSVNPSSSRVFSFPTNTFGERETLISFLEEVIPDNSFVWLFTVQKPDYDFEPEQWAQDSVSLGTNIFSILEAQGATQARQLETFGTVPYTFIYQKGRNTVFGEDIAPSIEDEITTEVFIPIRGTEGMMKTITIGPAISWEAVKWETHNSDTELDSSHINIYGVTNDGFEQLLFEQVREKNVLIEEVSTEEYPFLKVELYTEDAALRTAEDLKYLRVLYEGLPEAAVNPNKLLEFYADTLRQGEELNFRIAAENIGNYDMDSLLVKYTVSDAFNNEVVTFEKHAPLLKNNVQNLELKLETRELSGPQQLILEINPDKAQPELYMFNNFAIKPFYVEEDQKNPLLDVTFDGIHILDGDIISPQPEITITLKDENQFLALNDTSLFKLFIKSPGALVAENIPMEHEWVEFFPMNSSTNNQSNAARIILSPRFEDDGIYELIIQAEDASGNQSGDIDYKVSFDIITKSSLSNILNYPNPFSTSTQFVYTLTGEDIPDYFKIQIFTVSGKVVKEITQDEIGPLKVGTHRTEYIWDGTDDFGDLLANGVYLYRIVAKKAGGEGFESFENSTDSFFKRGFGKMMIIR